MSQVEQLLPQFTGFDIIFGPSSATQMPAVAEVCKEQGTRLVLPFWNGQTLQDYPLVYNAAGPSTVLYDAAVKKMMLYYADKNYVIVQSGNPDNHGKILTETLTQALAERTGAPRMLNLEGDDFAYESAFNQFRDNVILIDNSSIASLNTLLAHLKAFRHKHSQYRLSLFGYAEWQAETQNLLNDFFAQDTYIISPYFYNELDARSKYFKRNYERNFRAHILQNSPRYAELGFDLGYYFMSGLSRMGDTFEQMQSSLVQEPYQSWFRFERNASGMSFSNSFVQFIHFSPDNKIELIR